MLVTMSGALAGRTVLIVMSGEHTSVAVTTDGCVYTFSTGTTPGSGETTDASTAVAVMTTGSNMVQFAGGNTTRNVRDSGWWRGPGEGRRKRRLVVCVCVGEWVHGASRGGGGGGWAWVTVSRVSAAAVESDETCLAPPRCAVLCDHHHGSSMRRHRTRCTAAEWG